MHCNIWHKYKGISVTMALIKSSWNDNRYVHTDTSKASFIIYQEIEGKTQFLCKCRKNVNKKCLVELFVLLRGIITSLTFFISLFAMYYLGYSNKY